MDAQAFCVENQHLKREACNFAMQELAYPGLAFGKKKLQFPLRVTLCPPHNLLMQAGFEFQGCSFLWRESQIVEYIPVCNVLLMRASGVGRPACSRVCALKCVVHRYLFSFASLCLKSFKRFLAVSISRCGVLAVFFLKQ